MISAAVGAAILAFGGAAAAQPVSDADCVWSATTEPMRSAMRASLKSHGSITDALTNDQANGLMRACRLSNTSTAAGRLLAALRGRVLVQDAEQGLDASLRITPAVLEAAWRRMPATNRKTLTGAFDRNYVMPESLTLALNTLSGPMGVRSEADRELFYEYVVGRALLDAIGQR